MIACPGPHACHLRAHTFAHTLAHTRVHTLLYTRMHCIRPRRAMHTHCSCFACAHRLDQGTHTHTQRTRDPTRAPTMTPILKGRDCAGKYEAMFTDHCVCGKGYRSKRFIVSKQPAHGGKACPPDMRVPCAKRKVVDRI